MIWCVPDRFGQDAYDAVEQGPQQTGVDVWRGHVARSAAQARPQRQLCPALGRLQPQSCQPLRMPSCKLSKTVGSLSLRLISCIAFGHTTLSVGSSPELLAHAALQVFTPSW